MKTMSKPIEILLIEDNEGDVILTKEAFQDCRIWNNISVAMDGEMAMDMLKRREGFEDVTRPDLILLDINMPKKDGIEVLQEIKNDDDLKRIPVVILTSSKAEKDIAKTYDLHANSYLFKPLNLKQFVEVVQAIESFWFNIVVLPSDVESRV